MSPKRTLIAMTALAVVGDSMLIPFYPQFFAARYATTSTLNTGAYLAAISLVVVAALPVWARLARRVPAVRILVATQACAALLSIASAYAPTLATFWIVSLSVFAFKASYLLMYPYVMALEHGRDQAETIGLLSVIVHFGAIAGALLGGGVLQAFAIRDVFWLMAASDVLQMLLCLPLAIAATRAPKEDATHGSDAVPPALGRLLAAMLVFYFGAYLARPFFSLYWQRTTGWHSIALSGAVFALPALVALVGLAINRRRGILGEDLRRQLPLTLALGLVGLLLQAVPVAGVIVAGRLVYGWSLFQATVALDAALFMLSRPADYAADFAKANLAQNMGVVGAAVTAGTLFALVPAAPFLVGAAVFGATILVLPRVPRAAPALQPTSLGSST